LGNHADLRRASSFAPPLASLAHTSALVGVILAVAITGTLLQHVGVAPVPANSHGQPSTSPIFQQYLPLLLVNGLLVLYVARLFRPHNALPQLLGQNWRSPSDALTDLLYAAAAFVLILALETLTRPLFAGRNAAVSALLPSTEAERLTWLLVASTVGFSEEVVYRGYLQTQLSAFTRSPAAGLMLQGVLFGVAHLEQGVGPAFRIGIYGLILGLLARHRNRLLASIASHIGLDLASAFLPLGP